MASTSGVVDFNFKAARDRVELLTRMYRLAKRQGNYRACELLSADIQEIENDIQKAHGSLNGRVATLAGNQTSVIIIGNSIVPIVPQWARMMG